MRIPETMVWSTGGWLGLLTCLLPRLSSIEAKRFTFRRGAEASPLSIKERKSERREF